jgi:hypothetical protein
VIVRFTNSTMAWTSVASTGAIRPSSQVGQSVHPSPEPVSGPLPR